MFILPSKFQIKVALQFFHKSECEVLEWLPLQAFTRYRTIFPPALKPTSFPGSLFYLHRRDGVTAFWASPRFGHPHSQIPSVLGIPFSYYCSVLGIPRYPPGMPKSLVFWSSPPKKCWISRENRKRFRWLPLNIEIFSSILKRRLIRKA